MRTWLLAPRPRALFSDLHLEHTIIWRRLIAMALSGFVATYLLFGAVRLACLIVADLLLGPGFLRDLDPRAAMAWVLWPVQEPDYNEPDCRKETTTAWIGAGVLIAMAMPLIFLATRFTLPCGQARSRHLFRVALYSLITFPAVLLFWNGWVEVLQLLTAINIRLLPLRFQITDGQVRDVFTWTREHQLWIFAPLFVGWIFFFWYGATARYLRLDKPVRATAAILALSVTAALALFFFLPPGIRYLFAHR